MTIAGESAGRRTLDDVLVTSLRVPLGAGSVMLQAMAYGGSIGTSLFQNVSYAALSDGNQFAADAFHRS